MGRPLARAPRRADDVAGPRGSGRAATQPHLAAGRRFRPVKFRCSLRWGVCGRAEQRLDGPTGLVATSRGQPRCVASVVEPRQRGGEPFVRGRRRGRPARRGPLVTAADAVIVLGHGRRHNAGRRVRERAAGISQRFSKRFEFIGERQDTGAMVALLDCRGGTQELVRRGAVHSFGEHVASVAPIGPPENGVRRASPARPLPTATAWGHASAGRADTRRRRACAPVLPARTAPGGSRRSDLSRRMVARPGPDGHLDPWKDAGEPTTMDHSLGRPGAPQSKETICRSQRMTSGPQTPRPTEP